MFSVALTVETPAGGRRDVVLRASGARSVAELTLRLAQYLGLPVTDEVGGAVRYALRVRRTGELLRPAARLADTDLLEGDVLILLPGAALALQEGAEHAP